MFRYRTTVSFLTNNEERSMHNACQGFWESRLRHLHSVIIQVRTTFSFLADHIVSYRHIRTISQSIGRGTTCGRTPHHYSMIGRRIDSRRRIFYNITVARQCACILGMRLCKICTSANFVQFCTNILQ